MELEGFDHIVLCVADVARTLTFYENVLGMEAREHRPGKWSLHFGPHKISLQDAATAPAIASDTVPGSGNFCVISPMAMTDVLEILDRNEVEIVAGPGRRQGAIGPLLSVYFRDPDGNLVEVSNRV